MKKLFSALAIAVPIAAQAQAVAPRDTTVSASVSRTARATADRVTMYAAVEGIAETPQAALDRLQVKLKAVGDSVHRVAPAILLDRPISYGVTLAQTNSYPPPQGPLYSARAGLKMTLSRMSDMSLAQAAAITAGAVTVGGYSFESMAVDSIWHVKLIEAVQMSHDMAEASAKAAGFQLGSLISINTNGGPQNQNFGQLPQLSFDPRNYQQYAAPEINVTITVSASYRLVRK
ncbi:MAG: SIMPL domain-containing protein [Gemmatimonadaceae bacterium]